MARLITSSFELNDPQTAPDVLHPDRASTSGGGTYSSANPRIVSGGGGTGTLHGRCARTVSDKYFQVTLTQTTAVTYWFRSGFYLSALPAGTPGTDSMGLIVLRTASALLKHVDVDSNGTLSLPGTASSIGTVSAGSYFVLELKHKIDTANAANNLLEVLLEGVSIFTATGLSAGLGTTIGNIWRFGAASTTGSPGTVTVDVDDYAVNDDTGAAQNGSTGTGKIVLQNPISDNARTAGWVTGAGGTTSLFDAVNNIPPAGAADPGTATSQIRNATAEASASYDANLTSYTTAGIGANDTINVVDPFVSTAAPVTMSSKQGLIGMASNPAITTVALSATGTSGAFWAGSAAAAYPSGWKWSHGTTTYAPSVTKGSSPVIRITQVTSSTRIADVCALGMYTDYTPATPKSLVFDSRRIARNSLLRR